MKILSSKPEGADTHIIGQILKAAIIPIMDYGPPILHLASKTTVHRLHLTQNAAIRLAYGLQKWANVNTSHLLAGILPPAWRHHTIKFNDKVARDDAHPLHKYITAQLDTPPNAGKRKKNWAASSFSIIKTAHPGYHTQTTTPRLPHPYHPTKSLVSTLA